MSRELSDLNVEEQSFDKAVDNFNQSTLCFMAPGIVDPVMPDGSVLPCLRKNMPISSNLKITNQDLLLFVNFLTNSTKIGSVFISDNGMWSYQGDLNCSVDIGQFCMARSVCGRLFMISNTRTVDQAILDGSMSTIAAFTIPNSITFQNMGQYAIIDKGYCINSTLAEGQTLVAFPTYHSYLDQNAITNAGVREPDNPNTVIAAQLTGGGANENKVIIMTGSLNPLSLHAGFWIRLIPLTSLDPSKFYVTVSVRYSNVLTNGTVTGPISISQNYPLSIGVRTLIVDQEKAASSFPASLNFSFTGIAAGINIPDNTQFAVELTPYDPVFYDTKTIKYVTYVQGSTGPRNIVINGVVGYELIPYPENYSQVTLSKPAGSTFVPLETFTGLLNSATNPLRLVYQGDDFERFVEWLIIQDPKKLEQDAMMNLGHSSLLSTIASWVKRGIKGLKKIGVNPANLMRKGVDLLERNGYASEYSGGPATHGLVLGRSSRGSISDHVSSSKPFDLDALDRSVIQGGTDMSAKFASSLKGYRPGSVQTKPYYQNSGLVRQLPKPGLGTSTTPPPAKHGEGLFDLSQLEEEEPKQEAPEAFGQLDTNYPTVQQIVQAWPLQSQYNAIAFASIDALHDMHRYSAFAVMKGDEPYLCILEWSANPRPGHMYYSIWDMAPQFKMQKWLSLVRLDSFFFGSKAGMDPKHVFTVDDMPNELITLMNFFSEPQFDPLSSATSTFYITAHCSGVDASLGTSWSGALYHLIYGKDPSLIVEVAVHSRPAVTTARSFRSNFDAYVGDMDKKPAVVLAMNALIMEKRFDSHDVALNLWAEALSQFNSNYPFLSHMCFYADVEVFPHIVKIVKTKNWGSIYDPIDVDDTIVIMDSTWRTVATRITPAWSVYLAARSQSGKKVKIEQTIIEDDKGGTKVSYRLVTAASKTEYLPKPTFEQARAILNTAYDNQELSPKSMVVYQLMQSDASQYWDKIKELLPPVVAKKGASYEPNAIIGAVRSFYEAGGSKGKQAQYKLPEGVVAKVVSKVHTKAVEDAPPIRRVRNLPAPPPLPS